MTKCSYCDKPIGDYRNERGEVIVDTVYWHGDIKDKVFFCDAYCATGAHEKAAALFKLFEK